MSKRYFCKTIKGFVSIKDQMLSVIIVNATPGLAEGLEGKTLTHTVFLQTFEDTDKLLKFSEAFEYMKMGYTCRSDDGRIFYINYDDATFKFFERELETGRSIGLKYLTDVPFLQTWCVIEGV